MRPTDTELARPISAPALSDLDQKSLEQPTEEDKGFSDPVPYDPNDYKSNPEPVVKFRHIMTITNRQNWQHYYTMPANVGMNQVPWLVQALQEEGVALQDIQISFETKEIRQ